MVQQQGTAKTPPAGPFLDPASAAHSRPQLEQGQLHRPEDQDCKSVPSPQGQVDQVHLGPLGLGDFSEICFCLLVAQILTFLAPGPEAVRKGPRPGAARVQLGGGDLRLVFLWSLVHTASGAQVLGPLQRAHGPRPRIQAGYIGQ